MSKRASYSPEVRERAVRMVLTSKHEHSSRWATIVSILTITGFTTETFRSWVNKVEVDLGQQPDITSDAASKIKELERESRELKQANEIYATPLLFFCSGGARTHANRGSR